MPNRSTMARRCRYYAAALLGAAALTSSMPCFAVEPAAPGGRDDPAHEFHLRGYRGIRHRSKLPGEGPRAVAVHSLIFDDATHARWFVSKLYGDFALSQGNTVREVATRRGTGRRSRFARRGSDPAAVWPPRPRKSRSRPVPPRPWSNRPTVSPRRAASQGGPDAPALPGQVGPLSAGMLALDQRRRARRCRQHAGQPLTTWMGRLKVTAQLNTGYLTQDLVTNDNLLSLVPQAFAQHGVNYQRVEWLANQIDLYNRNPFFVYRPQSARCPARRLLRRAHAGRQPATARCRTRRFVDLFRRTAGDANQMALLDPDGEIGPYDEVYWGLYGPVNRREFVRFLQQVAQAVAGASVAALHRAAPTPIARGTTCRWPTGGLFYGWTDGAEDLDGPWRFQRDDNQEGFARGWSLPGYDDSGWVRLHYPGDALVFGLPAAATSRSGCGKRSRPRDNWPDRVYLSLAPLCQQHGAGVRQRHRRWARPTRASTPPGSWGQFDVTDEVKRGGPMTIALRFAAGDCPQGPIFLTPRRAEDFPTADPQVNARRWDHMEFIDWAVAQTVASTLARCGASIPTGRSRFTPTPEAPGAGTRWPATAAIRTTPAAAPVGNGPSPNSTARPFGLQDSSEPGSPVSTLREFRGIWGSLIFMGKNAHDYFLMCLHDIKGDPAKLGLLRGQSGVDQGDGPGQRAAFAAWPPSASRLRYRSEFAHWESWRYGVSPARGGEMVPLLNEVTLRKANLDQFRAIIDEGPPVLGRRDGRGLARLRRARRHPAAGLHERHPYVSSSATKGPGPGWPASVSVPRRARAGSFRSRRSTRVSAACPATSAPRAATAQPPPRSSRTPGPKCWASGPTAPPP